MKRISTSFFALMILQFTGESVHYNAKKSFREHEIGKVKFYVDNTTNSEDPEIRMAYGLNIVPPWSDGGSIFVNLPEHLEYMPETKGIARHHDKRTNVWQVSADSTKAS